MNLSLAAYLHNLDPFAFRLYGDIGIRWYGLGYAGGFVAALIAARWLARTGRIALSPRQVGDFIVVAILGVLLGGRLGWVLLYSPSALWTFTGSLPYWEVLAINRGGMSSHGGIIGVILAFLYFARRHHLPALHLWDVGTLITPFGLGFVRIANFINAELRGEPCADGFVLAVKYPQEIGESWGVGEMSRLAVVAGEFGMTRRDWAELMTGAQAGIPSRLDQLLQLKIQVVEKVRAGVQPVIDVVEPLLIARHPSQLYQALAEGVVLGAVLWALLLIIKPRKVGVICTTFLFVYGVLRIVTEIWRVPDEGIPRIMALSRGQWLSIVMIAVGLVTAWYVRRFAPTWPGRSDTRSDAAGQAPHSG